jgi:hypothetical protein
MPIKYERLEAIHYTAITVQFIAVLSNIALCVYLGMGKLRNKKLTALVLCVAILGIIYMSLVMLEQWVFRFTLYYGTWGQLLIVSLMMLHLKLLSIFSVLSKFWTAKRVEYLKVFSLCLHLLLCGPFYLSEFKLFDPILAGLGVLIFVVYVIIVDSSSSFYLVFLIYRDVKLMLERDSEMREEVKNLEGRYKKLCINLICLGSLDLIGLLFFSVAVFNPLESEVFGLIGISQLNFHSIIFVVCYQELRDLKFSKHISQQPKPNSKKLLMLNSIGSKKAVSDHSAKETVQLTNTVCINK